MTLAEALAQVELEAGRTYDCMVKGQRVVVRVGEPSAVLPAARYDESDVMLDPWTEFPVQGGIVAEVVIGKHSLPDVPFIPQDEP